MMARTGAFLRKRGWMFLLVLLGAVLVLPFQAARSGPAPQARDLSEPGANRELMAEILAAQLPPMSVTVLEL